MEVRVLGPLEVVVDSVPVALGSPKERALFALLVVQANKVVSLDRLADELWDGSPPDQAVAAVRVYVSHLRKVLPDGRLLTKGSGYELLVDDDELDAARFEHRAAGGRTQLEGGEASTAAATLRAALGEWRGTAFDGVQPTAAVSAETSRLAEERLAVLEDRIDADLQTGRHREVVGELTTMVGEHPLRERLWCLLIVALYRCGRQADALRAYQQARTKLVEELGIEPGAELRRIEAMVLTQDTALDAPGAQTPKPRHNLPAATTSFVGRARELGVIRDALGKCRLVTLTGTGGVGKTRLALEVASGLASEFNDGTWFVELGNIADADAVPEAVAAAVGIDARQGMTVTESLVDALRLRRVLLVIDNCEHVLDAVASLVHEIEIRCPQVSVIATSREGLDLEGERLIATSSLPVEGPESDAVRLFAERAQSAGVTLDINGADADPVLELVRRLDGIPLAIELAAARLRSMALADILARLDQRFRLLGAGRRGAVNRHQTLRRTLDWSHDLLDDVERAVFRRLAVFAGGFDVTAAEAVCETAEIDGAEVLDVMSRLVDKSLVIADVVTGTTRYRLLETTRDYATDQLVDAGEADRARHLHAEHYVSLLEQCGRGLRTRDELAWSRRLTIEFDNMRAAVMWAVETEDAALAVRALGELPMLGLYNQHAIGSWAEAVADLPGASSEDRYPVVLAFSAWSALQHNDVAVAVAQIEESATRARECAVEVRAFAMHHLTTTFISLGMVAKFGAVGAEWLIAARAAGDEWAILNATCAVLAARLWHWAEGDPLELIDDIVPRSRALGCPTNLANTFALAAACECVFGDPDSADRLFAEAREYAVQSGSSFTNGLVLTIWASFRLFANDYEACARLTLDCADMQRWNDRFMFLNAVGCLAAMLVACDADEDAAVLAEPTEIWRALAISTPDSGFGSLYQALADLPARLGTEKYAALAAKGVAMDDDELLAFAHAAVERALESR